MKIVQPDSRSIRVTSDSGVVFRLPYRFFWNEHERPAESIVLTSPSGKSGKGVFEVRAFFLFGEIRDRISSDANGITVDRTWLVKTPGAVHLSLHAEFEPRDDLRCFFPGVRAAQGMPVEPLSFLGEKTSYPGAVVVALGRNSALLFARSSMCEDYPAGIGISTTDIEDEPARLCVELRFPGIELPLALTGPRPPDEEQPEERAIESPGSLERSHQLFLAFAKTEDIHLRGAAAAAGRILATGTGKAGRILGHGVGRALEKTIDTARLAEALQSSLSTHLYQKDGVAGMREAPNSTWLSASAGVGCAIALQRLFPDDARLFELSLRLADFALKGQLPSGFFYERFDTGAGEWHGVSGQPTLLSVGQSSLIAERLLELSDLLAETGAPHEKYFMSGLRFVESFLDEKGKLSMPGPLHRPGSRTPVAGSPEQIGGLELYFPLERVLARTGKDRHKKAMDMLVKRFSALHWDPLLPPASREGRSSDSAGALVAAALFVRMRGRGYKPVEPPVSTASAAAARANESTRLFLSLVVPWVRLHPGEEAGTPGFSGCIVESFVRQRLLFAGNETAYLLLRLGRLTTDAASRALAKTLARLCLSAAGLAPLGTAFLQHTSWDEGGKGAQGRGKRGPVDARRLASEILNGLRINDEFPKL
jgi:hypothetical protein